MWEAEINKYYHNFEPLLKKQRASQYRVLTRLKFTNEIRNISNFDISFGERNKEHFDVTQKIQFDYKYQKINQL
jgi:hypothetical protein